MTVDDLLKSKELTAEEWELHKDIIEDCRNNEAMLARHHAETKHNIAKMTTVLDMISLKMVELSLALERIVGEAEDTSLRSLPEDKFYRE